MSVIVFFVGASLCLGLQEKLLSELKRKREKVANELKEAKAAKKEAERRCRQMEEEKEAICDDYEGRLQQQVIVCVG